jgi:hypothetical protein
MLMLLSAEYRGSGLLDLVGDGAAVAAVALRADLVARHRSPRSKSGHNLSRKTISA